jgi:glycosyltransferase involved in cell wall biosynthesis
MEISYYTVEGNLDTTRGYGNAGINVVTSLQKLGHSVQFDNPDSPVQLSFCQPAQQKFHDSQYKIGYTPWESTELPAGWLDAFNRCDEVWATSQWVANVYKNCGVKPPIYVYEHGLNEKWQPIKRERGEVVNFLHIGEPALRKGGQIALDAFRAAFGDRKDVHLTIKAYENHWVRAWKDGDITIPEHAYKGGNVTVLTKMMTPAELMDLYAKSDVLVYPSYGEGFGFIPLQALGTGMPVISTYDWAPYERFIQMGIRGRMDRSIWSVHPGNVLYPDYDDLVEWYRYAFDNIDKLHKSHYAQAPLVHQNYNWLTKTEEAFAHLVEKF